MTWQGPRGWGVVVTQSLTARSCPLVAAPVYPRRRLSALIGELASSGWPPKQDGSTNAEAMSVSARPAPDQSTS